MLLFLLSLIYLVFAHLFLPNLGGVLLHPREYLIWIALLGILSLSFIRVLKRGELFLPEGRVAFLLFILLSVSSSIFNPPLSKELFLVQSFHLLALYFIWLSLNQFRMNRKEKDRVLFLIFWSALIEALIGLMQFFRLYRFVPVTPLEGEGFVWGAFQQKNLFGSFIAVGLVISLHLISSPLLRSRRFLIYALMGAIPILGATIVFSNSRTAWIGLLIGSLTLLLLRFKVYKSLKGITLIWGLLVAAGVLLGVYLYGGSEEYKKAVLERESSNAQRILMLKTSLKMFLEKPVTGFGFANFPSLYMHHQAEVLEEEGKLRRFAGGFVSHPHNEIANIAVQSGILGLTGLLLVVTSFLRVLFKIGPQKAGLYVALLTPIVVHSLLEYPLELSVVHFFTFTLFLSLITSHTSKRVTFKLGKQVKAILYTAVGVFFLFSTTWTLRTFLDYMRMTLFAVEIERGRFRPELLEGAMKNVYLKLWAERMYMVERAKRAVENRDTEFLKKFVPWSGSYRKKLPLEEVYYMEAVALMTLGREYKNLGLMDESMKVVEEGVRLYPNSERLRSLKGIIFREAVEVLADQLRSLKERRP